MNRRLSFPTFVLLLVLSVSAVMRVTGPYAEGRAPEIHSAEVREMRGDSAAARTALRSIETQRVVQFRPATTSAIGGSKRLID